MFGVFVAVLTFAALVIRLMISVFVEDNKKFLEMNTLNTILNSLIIGVTIVIVAVPEGLPLAVTISLAFSVSKMYEENNLVRKLHAAESMGNANEICTDKTGTLT